MKNKLNYIARKCTTFVYTKYFFCQMLGLNF